MRAGDGSVNDKTIKERLFYTLVNLFLYPVANVHFCIILSMFECVKVTVSR